MIRIRPIQKQDLDQLILIEFESFTDPYPKELFQFLAGTHPDQFLVATRKMEGVETVLGYAVADIDQYMQYRVGHILSIAVGKQFRQRGLGHQLLSELIKVLKSKGCRGVVLEVRVSNETAQELYGKSGFQEIRRSQEFYENGEDAVIMALDLEEES
jgi:ribosomal-protein-alanine N-acetyltransferase